MPSITVQEQITFTHYTWMIHDVVKNTSCRLLIQLRNNKLPQGDDIVHKIWFNVVGDDFILLRIRFIAKANGQQDDNQ